MSKAFIDRVFMVLSFAMWTALAGCVTQPHTKPQAADMVLSPAPGEALSGSGEGGLPQWPPYAVMEDQDAPPEANRRNAAAFDEALAAIRSGRLGQAEQLLLEITADQPELSGPWVNLGQVYVVREQYEDARLALRQAIMANPRNCVARNQLGVLSRQLGDFAGAEEHYRACLEQVPDFEDAYLNLGILYELYLGRLPEALEAYRRYQILTGEADGRVAGWVADLQRRLGV